MVMKMKKIKLMMMVMGDNGYTYKGLTMFQKYHLILSSLQPYE